MSRDPVQETDRLIETVGKDMILGGFQIRICIGTGSPARLLIILLTAEERGKGVKSKSAEWIAGLAAVSAIAVPAVIPVLAAGTAPRTLCERIVISGLTG